MIIKKTLLSTAAVTIVTASILSGTAYAQTATPTPTPTQTTFFSSLVDKIAQTFGLEKSKVQAVVDQARNEHRDKRMQNMQTHVDNRLNQAVRDGKITDAQKTAIENKLAQEKSKFTFDSIKAMTPEQRHDAMQREQDELKAWATSQGIDPTYVTWGGLMGRRGMGRHMMDK